MIEKSKPVLPKSAPQFQGLLSSELSIQYGALDNTGPGFSEEDRDRVAAGGQTLPHEFPRKVGTADVSVLGINEIHVGTYRVPLEDKGDSSYKLSIRSDPFNRIYCPGNPPKDDYGRVRVDALLAQRWPRRQMLKWPGVSIDKEDPDVRHETGSQPYLLLDDPLVMKVDFRAQLAGFDKIGGVLSSAALQIFVDDFQAKNWGSHFKATLNGVDAPFIADVLNGLDQSGPVEQMVTIKIPDEYIPLLKSGRLNLSITETTGKGDGYAVDALFLYVNPDQATLNAQMQTELELRLQQQAKRDAQRKGQRARQ
ncbi:Uncharacterised protein [uncultured archaeon]|nr:Uncharacterised protein [uncultured archaeon]